MLSGLESQHYCIEGFCYESSSNSLSGKIVCYYQASYNVATIMNSKIKIFWRQTILTPNVTFQHQLFVGTVGNQSKPAFRS